MINLDRKHWDLEFFPFKKYSSFTFLDPKRSIFGVTCRCSDPVDIINEEADVKKDHLITQKYHTLSNKEASKRLSSDVDVLDKLKMMREAR